MWEILKANPFQLQRDKTMGDRSLKRRGGNPDRVMRFTVIPINRVEAVSLS